MSESIRMDDEDFDHQLVVDAGFLWVTSIAVVKAMSDGHELSAIAMVEELSHDERRMLTASMASLVGFAVDVLGGDADDVFRQAMEQVPRQVRKDVMDELQRRAEAGS